MPRAGTSRPSRLRPELGRLLILTGYWVSNRDAGLALADGDARQSDYVGIPMNIEAKKVADTWDPAKDEAAGEQCKSYGAPALMSVPGRLHITWDNDNTLKVDTDAGMQTRLLQFGERPVSADTPRTWQGVSVAQWQRPANSVALRQVHARGQ